MWRMLNSIVNNTRNTINSCFMFTNVIPKRMITRNYQQRETFKKEWSSEKEIQSYSFQAKEPHVKWWPKGPSVVWRSRWCHRHCRCHDPSERDCNRLLKLQHPASGDRATFRPRWQCQLDDDRRETTTHPFCWRCCRHWRRKRLAEIVEENEELAHTWP